MLDRNRFPRVVLLQSISQILTMAFVYEIVITTLQYVRIKHNGFS